LLKNYRKANGTMSEVFGPDHFKSDLVQRIVAPRGNWPRKIQPGKRENAGGD